MRKFAALFSLVIAALLLTSGKSRAALGWTLEQCRQYYGQDSGDPTFRKGNRVMYEFHGEQYDIGAVFFRGVNSVSRMIYVKKRYAITLSAIRDLLEVNVPGVDWGESYQDAHNPGETGWDVIGPDGLIQFCASLKANGVFSIWTQADNDAVNATNQSAQEASYL
jgi:hypothetical protein